MSDWQNLSAMPIDDALALLRRRADKGIEETLAELKSKLIRSGCRPGPAALQRARDQLTAQRTKIWTLGTPDCFHLTVV